MLEGEGNSHSGRAGDGKRRARKKSSRGKEREIKPSVAERNRNCAHCVGNNASHTAKRLAPQPQATMTITI